MTFREIIEYEKQKSYYQELKKKIDQEYATQTVYPPKQDIFRSLNLTAFEEIKVVIIGQDPYHEPGQANGLAFSVHSNIKIPPSLMNIYKECHDDLGCYIPNHGDLTGWAKQGVLLLNNVLTVRAHQANSHRGLGWEQLTLNIIRYLNQREKPLVFILWGKNAQEKIQYIDTTKHLIIKSSHPSPYSATYGFFGSKPFSKANAFLMQHHIEPIDWQIKNIERR